MRLILEAILKTASLWRLRRAMRNNAKEMLWLRDQIASDTYRLEWLERSQRNMQANVWMIEAPGPLVKESHHRLTAGLSYRKPDWR